MATNTEEIKKLKKEFKGLKDSLQEILDIVKTSAVESSANKEDSDEVGKLKKEIDDFKATLDSINKSSSPEPIIINKEERDVLFTSLYPGMLNLSTDRNGQGEVYTFNEFGEEKNIPYAQARQIIKNNRHFITGGLVFINDDDIIKVDRLENDYKKILDKDSILKLFNSDKEKFSKVYNNMTTLQKEILHTIIVKRMAKGKNVDYNIVKVIDDDLHCDIASEVENGKNLIEQ